MKLMDTIIITVAVAAIASALSWSVARWYYQDRWRASTRMEGGTVPVPVRQTRVDPPLERYQEYRSGRWVDVPYEERGPHYMEKYPR